MISEKQKKELDEIFEKEPFIGTNNLSMFGSFRIDPITFEKIETKRGRIPRSVYVSDIIEKALEAE